MFYSSPQPPIAKREETALTIHGHTRIDPYYWMHDKENPEVIAYLEAENAYRDAKTAASAEFRDTLYHELIGRIQETDDTVPVPHGLYDYYTRTEQGKQYSIQCRKRRDQDSAEQILLDLNTIADENGYEYLMLGFNKVSPDHTLLAYGLDTTGAETLTVRFKNLETGELLSDVLENVALNSAEWADNTTFFYVTEQETTKRSDKLHRHILGSKQSADKLVYHEPDGLYDVEIMATKDRRYLILGSTSIETHERHYLAASNPLAQFQLIQARTERLRYTIEHRNGFFYIVTNADGATNNQLMRCSVATPSRADWQALIPQRADVTLEGIELFADHLVRYEREHGLKTIHITHFSTDETHRVQFPESVYTYHKMDNPEFDSTVLRYEYTSLVTPESVFDYEMNTRQQVLRKQQPVLGGYDQTEYVTERIFATADDGAQVPISLVYRRDAWDRTPAPCHMLGYGSYGLTIDPQFHADHLTLLDRGVIVAIAHVRGSQMMGRGWYEDGKFLNKKNTFTDFIACATHLIAHNYTASDRLTAVGGSAGGLLIGAVVNLAPALFTAVIAAVPFVDVVTTMLDESLPSTIQEFDEWGNPKDETYYWYMLDYSPYDQVKAQAYPHMLITGGLNDPRVEYWMPAKWTAKLRALKTDDNDILLQMNMGAGHFASSGRYDFYREIALHFAFLLEKLKLAERG